MSNVESAFQKYEALVAIEKATGTKTTRARNEILRALPDAELTELAVRLKGADLIYGYAPLYDPAAK